MFPVVIKRYLFSFTSYQIKGQRVITFSFSDKGNAAVRYVYLNNIAVTCIFIKLHDAFSFQSCRLSRLPLLLSPVFFLHFSSFFIYLILLCGVFRLLLWAQGLPLFFFQAKRISCCTAINKDNQGQ